MEENKNTNLNNVNGVQNNSNTGATPSAPSFSSTSSQNAQPSSTPKFSTSSSGYIRPEDIVRGPVDANKPKTTPVFAYSKSETTNPYLPSGYAPTTQTPNPAAPSQNNNVGTISQASGETESIGINNQVQAETSQDLSFSATPVKATSSTGFEVVGEKAPTAVSRSKNLKKLNASRRTESRFCGHFAWFFSISNVFVCLFYVLVNILLSQITGENAPQDSEGIVATLNSIIEIAPYATLVVCAFTLIALINSIIQLTIRVNKYSKLTIIIVFLLSIAAFVYLYFVGYLGETLKLLNLVTS